MKQWVKETMTERVVRQLAKKFHWFDPVVTTAGYLSIHYEKDLSRGRTRRENPVKVAKIRQVSKPGHDGWWCKIESVYENAPQYVKELEGTELPRELLELEVRNAAFEYEARQLLVKEAQDVLRRNSLSNDSAR